jgi:hypothetical protein
MIKIIKLKMSRHQFDALNTALQQYIPHFVSSNNKDVEPLAADSRERLARRVMTSLMDDLKYNLQKVSQMLSVSKSTIKLSEAEAIAMYFLLLQLPVHPADQFTLKVVNQVISDLHQEFIKPITGPRPVANFLSIQKY